MTNLKKQKNEEKLLAIAMQNVDNDRKSKNLKILCVRTKNKSLSTSFQFTMACDKCELNSVVSIHVKLL
jgi:hypothetical protein